MAEAQLDRATAVEEPVPADWHREYLHDGLIRHAMPLADPGVLPALCQDASLFDRELAELQRTGQRRVPYRLTPAIERVARDPNLIEVIGAILGEDEALVMWGSNIQRQVPNAAGRWHVDIESWHWPTLTVVIGLAGCTPAGATRCIPGSHRLRRQPPLSANDATVLQAARAADPACNAIDTFAGFTDGSFYLFNARAWHCGNHAGAGTRLALFLHYQRAREPRIPYMKDFRHGTWFDRAAAYLPIAGASGQAVDANERVYPRPRRKLLGYLAALGWRV